MSGTFGAVGVTGTGTSKFVGFGGIVSGFLTGGSGFTGFEGIDGVGLAG